MKFTWLTGTKAIVTVGWPGFTSQAVIEWRDRVPQTWNSEAKAYTEGEDPGWYYRGTKFICSISDKKIERSRRKYAKQQYQRKEAAHWKQRGAVRALLQLIGDIPHTETHNPWI